MPSLHFGVCVIGGQFCKVGIVVYWQASSVHTCRCLCVGVLSSMFAVTVSFHTCASVDEKGFLWENLSSYSGICVSRCDGSHKCGLED